MTLSLILFALVLGLYIGFVLPYWYTAIILNKEKNASLKDLIPLPVDEYLLCQGPHSWIEATVKENSTYSLANVCQNCGFIPSKNMMATSAGIKQIIEYKRQVEKEVRYETEFISNEQKEYEGLFAEEIKNGLSVDKLFKVYGDGQTSYKRFILFKLSKLESEEKNNG